MVLVIYNTYTKEIVLMHGGILFDMMKCRVDIEKQEASITDMLNEYIAGLEEHTKKNVLADILYNNEKFWPVSIYTETEIYLGNSRTWDYAYCLSCHTELYREYKPEEEIEPCPECGK